MTTSGADVGVKQITVKVYDSGQLLATQIAIRTSPWSNEDEQ